MACRMRAADIGGEICQRSGLIMRKEKYGYIKNLLFFCDDAMKLSENGIDDYK